MILKYYSGKNKIKAHQFKLYVDGIALNRFNGIKVLRKNEPAIAEINMKAKQYIMVSTIRSTFMSTYSNIQDKKTEKKYVKTAPDIKTISFHRGGCTGFGEVAVILLASMLTFDPTLTCFASYTLCSLVTAAIISQAISSSR